MEQVDQRPENSLVAALRARWSTLRARALGVPAVARSVRTIVVLAASLRSESITLRAAALTYLSVLSLVPLLAVVFSMFAVFGTAVMKDDLQEYILQNLAVGARETIARELGQGVRRAAGTAVGGIGFVFLLVSAVSLMTNIETAFNATFRVTRKRPFPVRFGIYWCLLTLGPILLALSIAATALLESSRVFDWLGAGRRLLLLSAPFFVTWSAFALLYVIVPATTVKRRAALLGAIVAGSAWEIAKIVYAAVSSATLQKNAIYGSLSAIPIFLLWVYISWLIVLFGARIAYAAQAPREFVTPGSVTGPLGREVLFAHLVEQVARDYASSAPPLRTRDLVARLGLEEGAVRPALETLQEQGIVREVAAGGWVPGRPLSQLSLAEVRRAARGEPAFSPTGEAGTLVARWSAADAAADAKLNETYATFFERERAVSAAREEPTS